MRDFVQRFHFMDSPVRGELTQLSDSLQAALEHRSYPPRIQSLLGELIAASALLAATLKFDGSLILQARGDGPLETLMAECNQAGDIRAIAQIKDDWSGDLEDASLQELLGNGQLAITIDPVKGQRYQGIVPLEGQTLAACLEHYFAHSEQLPTRLWLAADQNQAGGLLLQIMPGTTNAPDADQDIWPRLQQLTDTVTAEELTELPASELLYRLYHEEELELFDARDVRFNCSCSRERTEQALLSIGEAELHDILQEEGSIRVSCQFCNQEYVFDTIDVEQMLRGGSGQIPSLH